MSGSPDAPYVGYMIGGRITRLRKQKGFTQAKLASRLHVTASNISQLEAGSVSRSPGELALLARLFEVDPLHVIAGLAPETCQIVQALEQLSPARRAAAVRLFDAALQLADAKK